MTDAVEFQDKSRAYGKFNHQFNAIYYALQDPSKKIEHAALPASLLAMVQAFVRHDLDVNFAIESSHFMNNMPMWFASMCLAEEIKFGASTIKARVQAVASLWKLFEPLSLNFQSPSQQSLTGRALHGCYYGTVNLMRHRDKHVEEGISPPLNNAIPRRNAKKLTAMAIELMDQLYAEDPNVNRCSAMNGVTPLMVASALTNIECMTWLIERGADVNARDARSGATPIMHALDSKYGIGDFGDRMNVAEALRLLMDHGADIDIVSSTQEDFGRLVLNCKALKGEERAFYKNFWKEHKAKPGKSKDTGTKQELQQKYLCEGIISARDIQQLHSESELFYWPYPRIYATLIDLVVSRGALKFTVQDMTRFVDASWNGISMSEPRRDFSPKMVEKQLNKFVVGGIKRGLNLHRDEQGIFHILSATREPHVVAVR
jgi:Ankyrin repeats (3 copies)